MAQGRNNSEWRNATKLETLVDSLSLELTKLLETAPEDKKLFWQTEFDGFKEIFKRFLHAKPTITWNKIEPIPKEAIISYNSLSGPIDSETADRLSKLVVVKLNGGLGTTMGCKGPKCAIDVRQGLTFLDLTMQQIEAINRKYKVDVPLVLMNSFNTDEYTKKILEKYKRVGVSVYTFNQSCYPRIDKETLMPIAKSVTDSQSVWYPPGHGDFFEAFSKSKLLDRFISQGKEYCFISNMDNLCATPDINILNFLLESHGAVEYVMEVVDRTRADIKGQTLIQYDGRLTALDPVLVPRGYEEEFKSVKKFRVFNTNNIWVNLPAIKRLAERNQIDMEILVNPKTMAGGVKILQLELAIGAAIKSFNGAVGINVPRSRFLPIKKCQDLFLAMCNLYDLQDGTLTLSECHLAPTVPLIKLGSHYDKVEDFLDRFPEIPDVSELEHLTIAGDVWFGRGVILKGTVIIIANHGERIDIPPGAILEDRIVSGNLRIVYH